MALKFREQSRSKNVFVWSNTDVWKTLLQIIVMKQRDIRATGTIKLYSIDSASSRIPKSRSFFTPSYRHFSRCIAEMVNCMANPYSETKHYKKTLSQTNFWWFNQINRMRLIVDSVKNETFSGSTCSRKSNSSITVLNNCITVRFLYPRM